MRRRPRLSGPAGPLLGVALGLLVATVVTLLQEPAYRADASIVIARAGQPPGSDPGLARATQAAAELFDSRAVAESAIRNLGLDETPSGLVDRLDVDAQEGSSLLRIAADAPSADEAHRIAQEASEVATVLFNDRFAPQTIASIWEPASAEAERISPVWSRNLALGALIGALVGFGLVLVGLRERGPRPVTGRAPRPARRPRAQHVAVAEPVPQPVNAAAPAPAAPATGPFVLPGVGRWTIGDVERLVAEQGHAFPELGEEFELYLDSLRSVAGPDGDLPGDVDLVVEDVFAPLIARSGSARTR
jgi:capsular polysaccharide biosynthesis protein